MQCATPDAVARLIHTELAMGDGNYGRFTLQARNIQV